MSVNENILSEKSSFLNSEQLLNKRKKEKYGYLIGIIAQIFWAMNGVHVKTFRPKFPEEYTVNSVALWRFAPVTLFGFLLCKFRGVRIIPHREIKDLKWFIIRNVFSFFSINLWVRMLNYFRVSTTAVIGGVVPLLIIFISVFVLGEKFYIRYVISILICILGSSIIILNDKNPSVKAQILEPNTFVGIIIAIAQVSVLAFSLVGQKVLVKEGMDLDLQNYFLGLYTIVPASLVCLIQRSFGFSNLKYIGYVSLNGFIFYGGSYLTSYALMFISISKLQPVTYLCLVFTFILSNLLLSEPIFFSDIIGGLLIIACQYYNLKYPVGRQVNNNKNNNNIINNNEKDKKEKMIFEKNDNDENNNYVN